MSTPLTVSDLQASRIPTALNICPTDDRFYQWLNEAEDRMLVQGRWLGSYQEAQWCVDRSACLVFNRRVAAVEQLAVCGQPIRIENPFFPFTRLLANLEQCAGCRECSGGGRVVRCTHGHLALRMRAASACSFKTIAHSGDVMRVYAAGTSDAGKTITLQGKDRYGQWTSEVVTLTDPVVTPFVDTVTQWGVGAPQAVKKDITDGVVRLYEVLPSGSDVALAEYEGGETRPMYQVGYVPGLDRMTGCCNGRCTTDDDAPRTTITGLVSLQHVELRAPSDWLVLRNLSAYKEAMVAVKAWEDGDVAGGNYHFYGTQSAARNGRGVMRVVNRGGAIPLLQAELRKATGDRFNSFVYTDETDRLGREMLGFR